MDGTIPIFLRLCIIKRGAKEANENEKEKMRKDKQTLKITCLLLSRSAFNINRRERDSEFRLSNGRAIAHLAVIEMQTRSLKVGDIPA